jgi:hypothetical protein
VLDLRLDVEADMKELDRRFGAWFGREGGQSTSALEASNLLNTWLLTAFVSPHVAVRSDAACGPGLGELYFAATTVAQQLEGLMSHLYGQPRFQNWNGAGSDSLSKEFDRNLPKALGHLEACS